jgi:hypothetical protein
MYNKFSTGGEGMTVINNEWQIKIFRKLVELAGGDRDLARGRL